MKKTLLFLIFCFTFPQLIQAQNPGDTILVQTFIHDAWTDGNGNTTAPLGSARDTIAYFPNDTSLTFEKIIMSYNMRCKDNKNNNPGGNSRVGCGAWDYSCHTYIHDSTRIDSILSLQKSHNISNFSGNTYNYSINPVYHYTQYIQQTANATAGTASEDTISIGSGIDSLDFVVATDQKAHKSQFLYLADELYLLSFGPVNQTINALSLNILDGGTYANHLSIKLKLTTDTLLLSNNPHTNGFTEVYNSNTMLNNGINKLYFTTPFVWDSVSNIIVEFSLTNTTPTSATLVEGEQANSTLGLYSSDANYITVNSAESIDLPVSALSSISNEVTVSFWIYGDENVLPKNTTIIEAYDSTGKRTLNIHFPWSNGRMYWDCGNSGTSSYDRIDKAANLSEYTGEWSHWAFTKNASTGSLKVYRNGLLWHSGTGHTRTIDIATLKLASNGASSAYFWDGNIKELRIFDKEISPSTIYDWMNKRADNTHPDYANLVAHYPLWEGGGVVSLDETNSAYANFSGNVLWNYDRGHQINQFFTQTNWRPNISFYQGNYTLTFTNDTLLDSLVAPSNIVDAYAIVPNWGMLKNDSIANISTNSYWEAVSHTYDINGNIISSDTTTINGTITISDLTYYKRYPMAFQIMSFVTPYGGGVNFGAKGKTWYFDVTDYAPVLKGKKQMTVSGGGQWQEDLDIKFHFIVGTPPRDVLEMQQIWRPQSKGYSTIMSDGAFEPRINNMLPNASAFKLRASITGHGADGEFIPRIHYLNIDAANPPIKSWQVWTECSENPVYPQGGTWIYDRAGWCPGQATDLVEVDITSLVTPGQNHIFDYGVNSTGSSNYWVSNQLVSYGDPNFALDATVVEILSPTDKIVHSRNNPTCSNPKIIIQNTGSSTLTSLTIEYWINNANNPEIFTWSGNLEFLEKEEIELPSTNSLWQSLDTNQNIFYAQSKNPNGSSDQYQFNDLRSANFEPTPIYPAFFGLCVQTNSGVTNSLTQYSETSWDLFDDQGNTIYSSGTLLGGTQYRDSITLNAGCYRFEVFDTDDDGLDFWANNDGSGIVRFITTPISCNAQRVKDFDGDFGRSIVHHFRVENITTFQDKDKYPWEIFPNPTKNSIQIKGFIDEETTLNIYSNLGKLLISQQLNFQGIISKEIDLSDFPTGVYFINIQNTQEKIIKKVVKL